MVFCGNRSHLIAFLIGGFFLGSASGPCLASATLITAAIEAPGPASSAAHDYRDRNFDYFVSGDPRLPRAVHSQFGLALMGGGGNVDAAFQFIASHAGGGHIVILRAVADDTFDADGGNYGQRFMTQWGPVISAETIVFRHRDASADARVIAALRGADGIFIAGGDQANYIRYWKGTPVQDALNAHVKANRPLGGSSAGLAILGHYSYTALDGGSMESSVALADPLNAGVTLESDFLHYAGLEHVITDTHFSARKRLGRLITFVARINADSAAAKVFGIGIDEKTALLIDANGTGHIAAGSAGNAWLVMPNDRAPQLVKAQPLSISHLHLHKLDGNSSIDLGSGQVRQAAADALITIERGKLAQPSIASPIFARDVAPAHES